MNWPFCGCLPSLLECGYLESIIPNGSIKIGKFQVLQKPVHMYHYANVNFLNSRKFKQLMMGISLVASFMACIYPWINSFALMSLGIPTFALLTKELKK